MSSVKKQKSVAASCQQYLKIAEIRDNVAVLKDGSIRAVIKVNSVNFDLKSEEEQNGIIYSYQQFLNTLEFPIQIIIKSKKLDIENYLEHMKHIYMDQPTDLMRNITANYIDYITKLVEISDIMQKDFYVVVPVDPIQLDKLNPFQKFLKALNPGDSTADFKKRNGEFESLSKTLDQRAQSVLSGFANMGIQANRLTTYELIELYYKSYNPDIAEIQKIKDVDRIDIPTSAENKKKEEESE